MKMCQKYFPDLKSPLGISSQITGYCESDFSQTMDVVNPFYNHFLVVVFPLRFIQIWNFFEEIKKNTLTKNNLMDQYIGK